MILVWRICAHCGRRFSFWHKPGVKDMRVLCDDCRVVTDGMTRDARKSFIRELRRSATLES